MEIGDITNEIRFWFPLWTPEDIFWMPYILLGGDDEVPESVERAHIIAPGDEIPPVGGIDPIIGAINSISINGDDMSLMLLCGYNDYHYSCNGYADTWQTSMNGVRTGALTMLSTAIISTIVGGWEVESVTEEECPNFYFSNMRIYFDSCSWEYTRYRSSLPTTWTKESPFGFLADPSHIWGDPPLNLTELVANSGDTSDKGLLWGESLVRRYVYYQVRLTRQSWVFVPPVLGDIFPYFPPFSPLVGGMIPPFVMGGTMMQAIFNLLMIGTTLGKK